MGFGPFSIAEVGVAAWPLARTLVTVVLVLYLVHLARRHVRAQERIADALDRQRGGDPGLPR